MQGMVVKIIKKYIFVILAVLIAVGGYFYIRAVGSEYTYVRSDLGPDSGVKDVFVEEDSLGTVEVISWEMTDRGLMAHLRSVKPGRVYLTISCPDKIDSIAILYVHDNGVITYNKYFGDCTGASVVIFCFALYFMSLAGYFIFKYVKSLKKSIYNYDNILYLGLIIFILYLVYSLITSIVYRNGVGDALWHATSSTQSFVILTSPLVLVTTVVVTISNVQLIRKEGRTWRNMLGFILGLMLGIGSLLPIVIGQFLFNSPLIDVHYERGIGRFIELFLENIVSAYVTYLECILIGTIVIALRAARRIPKFNKDYIIIHGCQIRKDGTLTKLLQSRADRALEFAGMQKKATGKDIIFVPSGGKGSDEIISEGEAIKRYLLECGVSENQILEETDSSTTEENFKFANKLIKEHYGSDGFNLAFSTTNYHVFRSGMLAEQQGIKAEGIGSPTKRYFWINAFVREFIASIVIEKKMHVRVGLIILLINILSIVMMYISEAILS